MGLTHLFLMTGKDVPTFSFYNKLGFRAAENMVAFAKDLRNYVNMFISYWTLHFYYKNIFKRCKNERKSIFD